MNSVDVRVNGSSSTNRSTQASRNARSCDTTTIPPGKPVDEALQLCERVEVEVVRGLVEQEDVEARERDRGQRGSGALPARQGRHRPVERVGRQPEVVAGARCPRLEVVAAQGLDTRERLRVPLDTVEVFAHVGGQSIGLLLRRRDTGAAGEHLQQGLVVSRERLLFEVADGDVRGGALDGALVGNQQSGADPQQRRLADAVGAEQTEPRARAHGQRHVAHDGSTRERHGTAANEQLTGHGRLLDGRDRVARDGS